METTSGRRQSELERLDAALSEVGGILQDLLERRAQINDAGSAQAAMPIRFNLLNAPSRGRNNVVELPQSAPRLRAPAAAKLAPVVDIQEWLTASIAEWARA